MSVSIIDILKISSDNGASDIHLRDGVPPLMRIDGDIVSLPLDKLEGMKIAEELKTICADKDFGHLESTGGLDFGFSLEGHGRFRINAHKSKGSYGIVARRIPDEILNFDSIGLPESVKGLLKAPRGLILVTGPTGSGKSTTLASMINVINEDLKGHIVTIEDPIEYSHQNKNCVVTQREIGRDVAGFSPALREVLRQDPDVILVGEMRDLETMEAAVTAAETGHLVFATLHTTGAARTVDRIVDAFPSHMKGQIRTQLASSILAVISQVLCKKKDEGRVASFEVMMNTPAISQLIRDDKTFRIASEIQTGLNSGMVSLDRHLANLVNEGLVDQSEAQSKAQSEDQFLSALVKNDKD